MVQMEIKFEYTRLTTKVQPSLARVRKGLGKFQVQYFEKLRKVRLRKNDGFVLKDTSVRVCDRRCDTCSDL